jgi:endonuclease YncB( thermonuclease family)
VNIEQIKAGVAWHFKRYEEEQPLADRLAYGQAESEALAARRGIWGEPQPVAPWEFRRR